MPDRLEKRGPAGEIWPSFTVLASEMYDPLRGAPRFAAIVRRIGLDVPTLTSPHGGRLTK